MPDSKGDPRVLFVMNLVLSALFAYVIVWGLAFIDVTAFAWGTVALLTAALMALTYAIVY